MSEPAVPLADYVQLRTDDLDEAREKLGLAVNPHRLHLLGSAEGLHVVHNMAELGSTAFHYVDYGADVRVAADELGFVLVEVPLEGRSVITTRNGEVVATPEVAAVNAPADAPSNEYFAPNPRLMIRIDAALLESRLAVVLGDRPRRSVRFDPALDLGSAGGRSWRRVVDTIVADFDNGAAISRSPLAAQSLERVLADGLLSVQGNSYSERIHAAGTSTRARSLRKAVSLIEDHCAEPLTTADVAEAVGVSPRSLQEAFHSQLDTTPMAYLRAVRLRNVHAELQDGGDGATVTDIALRWGITHYGRFTQEYRRMYGRSPSQTLREGH